MTSKLLPTTFALLLACAPLAAQQPAPPPAASDAAQPPAQREQMRRGGQAQAGAPAPREGRGEMRPPAQAGQPGWGPQNPQPPQPPHGDPFMENFFPPELIMHHQHAIGLSDDQRKRLIEIVQKAGPQFTEAQWQLEAEQATLMSLMRTERPDEKLIAAQLDKVLKLEGDMKRGQLMMLVRLKNELTTEQQMKLREAMRRPAARGVPGMPAPR